MKTCPSCGAQYSDDLTFCLQDGTRLSGSRTDDLSGSPTERYNPATIPQQDIASYDTTPSPTENVTLPSPPRQFQLSAVDPKSRMGCIVTLGQVSLGLLLVSLIGLGGAYFFTFKRGGEIASSPPASNSVPRPESSNRSYPGTAANSNAAYPADTASGNAANNAPKSTPAATPLPKPSSTPIPPEKTPKPASTPEPEPQPTQTYNTPSRQGGVIAGGHLNSRAISLPQPPYPPAARAVRAAGMVRVRVLIDEGGRVIAAQAVTGHPLLRAASESAARAARFEPPVVGGAPVKVRGFITYNFIP